MNADLMCFREYNDKVRSFFRSETGSKLYFFDVGDLDVSPENEKLG